MHALRRRLATFLLLAGCAAPVGPAPGDAPPEPDEVGARQDALVSAGVFQYEADEQATKALVAPLADVGYTVALELTRTVQLPFGYGEVEVRRIVAFAVDHDLELTGAIFDTGYEAASWANELVAAVPTRWAERTAIITRELYAPGWFDEYDVDPWVVHHARTYHPYEEIEESGILFTDEWPGRPEGAGFLQYQVHQACGRLAGDDFLLIAERHQDDAPDSYRATLFGLRVDAETFEVLDQVELDDAGWRGLPANPVWPDVECTDAHDLETGWMVVRRAGGTLLQHRLPSSFLGRVGRSTGTAIATPADGERLGAFRVAGTELPEDEGERYMLVVEREDEAGTRLTSLTLREPFWRGVTREWRELGPTRPGGLALAYDRHSMAEWYLLDRSRPDARAFPADETRLRRLGFDGFAYAHRRVSSAFVGNPAVTHAHGVDEALFVYTNDVAHVVQAGHYAPRPRSYWAFGDGSQGRIGPRRDGGGSYLGGQPTTAMNGNDAFTVTADGTWPNWSLELVVSDRLTYADGAWIPDESRGVSRRFRARSDAAGDAEMTLPLGRSDVLHPFYPVGPAWPRFQEGGLISGPSALYMQWAWTEIQIDFRTWRVRSIPRRSDVLGFVPGS